MENIKSSCTISEFVEFRNKSKKLFTAGPASLLEQNITGLMPCFGRGDDEYIDLENRVLSQLARLSGHKTVARMQGSGSLALEIIARNFLSGRVLIVSSGTYSDRLELLSKQSAAQDKNISKVDNVNWTQISDFNGNYDWIFACYTETSLGIKVPVEELSLLAKRCGARLALDATASIGLEEHHDLADVIGYSSCKGLFGLTGACFVAFNDMPKNEVNSFYLDINSHLEKKMTGPYHSLCSLHDVLPVHQEIKKSVENNKNKFLANMKEYLTVEKNLQPLLCTHVTCEISSNEPTVVLYKARNSVGGSIVCHIGEAHLGSDAKANIQEALSF